MDYGPPATQTRGIDMQDYWIVTRKVAGEHRPYLDTWSSSLQADCPTLRTKDEAERSAKWWNAYYGEKDTFGVIQLTDADWKWVASWRIYQGEWDLLHWLNEPRQYSFLKWDNPIMANHFPHIAKGDPSKIAFIEDDAKGRADRVTVMKPGRFLTKFFSDVLSADEIADLANRYVARSQPGELKIARTADEIEHVYTNGPNSCMAHPAEDYDSSVHPARVYASPDLGVAYILRGDITARAVVWPEKKQYSRIYGDRERLEKALQDQGYSEGYLSGARLVRIEDDDGLVCPYLDKIGTVDDDGEWLRIDGDIDAQNTNGLIDSGSRCTCDRCERRMDEDEAYYVHVDRWTEERWCEHCENNHAVYCEAEERTVAGGAAVSLADGSFVSEWVFESEGFVCEGNGENYRNDDAVVLSDGTVWSQDYFEDHGAFCSVTEENHRIEDMVCHPDLGWVHKETDEARAILDEADDTGTASVSFAAHEVA